MHHDNATHVKAKPTEYELQTKQTARVDIDWNSQHKPELEFEKETNQNLLT